MEDITRTSEKVKQIIDAAQFLFGVHGFEKVSMNEIAEELKISKASLYYYFPDKENLCTAVLEKEKSEFISSVSLLVENIAGPEQMLIEYCKIRLSYFRRFLNLSRLRQETYSTLRPVFREVLLIFQEKEKEIIKRILLKGMEDNTFRVSDLEETASLFLDVLRGLSKTVINFKRTMTIEDEEYNTLLRKYSLFTQMYIKALKAN